MKIIVMQFMIFIFVFFNTFKVYATDPLLLVTSHWPPYEYQEDGNYKGSDVEILNEAFKRMNIQTVIGIQYWNTSVDMIKNQTADAIFTLRRTPERDAFMIFPDEPLNYSENVFFYKKGKTYQFAGKIDDIKGLAIGITEGYAYGDELMNSTLIKLVNSKRDSTNIKKLLSDNIDLFICDKMVAIYELKQLNYMKQVDFLPTPYSKFDMFIAFSKKPANEKLVKDFSNALKAMKADGTYNSIINKYINY